MSFPNWFLSVLEHNVGLIFPPPKRLKLTRDPIELKWFLKDQQTVGETTSSVEDVFSVE